MCDIISNNIRKRKNMHKILFYTFFLKNTYILKALTNTVDVNGRSRS